MSSSYVLRNITSRTTLPSGTVLTSANYGPTINSTYPLGAYLEDYTFSSRSGDLDIYNGRYCVTPDYPNGTYAYFVTVDSTYTPAYPFVVGPQFYGSPINANMGPGGGKFNVTETVTTYFLL